MPRISILDNPLRVTANLEKSIWSAGVERAESLGLRGGFSEYLARLIVADTGRKVSAASRVSRHLPKARKAA